MRHTTCVIAESSLRHCRSHPDVDTLSKPDQALVKGLWRFPLCAVLEKLTATSPFNLREESQIRCSRRSRQSIPPDSLIFSKACLLPGRLLRSLFVSFSSACTSACHHATLILIHHLAQPFLLALGPSPTSSICPVQFLRGV